MQNIDLNTSVAELGARFKEKTQNHPNAEGARLVAALSEGRYSFALEPWHDVPSALEGVEPSLPAEALLRPFDDKGVFGPFPGVRALNKLGLGTALDKCIVCALLPEAAQRVRRLAVNTAASSWEDASFIDWVEAAIPANLADKFVLEITEDVTGEHALLSRMEALRAKGIKFALDDFTNAPFDIKRAHAFAPVIDFMKFSGNVIEEGLRQPYRLKHLVGLAQEIAPEATLIAEWVKSPFQAIELHKKYSFCGMQGRSLPADEDVFAKQVRACAKTMAQRKAKYRPSML